MKKMNSAIEYGIIGLGTFGTTLAKSLAKANKEVMVLDCDEFKIRKIKDIVDEAFVVKNLDTETLLETGIKNCKTVIVCISKDVAVSVLTTLNLVNLGVKRVLAKALSYEQGMVLEKMGAEVIYPESDMAVRLANKLLKFNSVEFMELSGNITIAEIKVPASFVGKTIKNSGIRQNYGLNIVAIESGHNTIMEVDPDYILKENDLVVLAGTNKKITKFENKTNIGEK